MNHLLIGDIHGCWDELQELLDRAALAPDDEIIALGDIVDRGPDTVKVLDFFMQRPNARTLQGNHERKHVASFEGRVRPAFSQQISRLQLGEERYPADCAFMDGLPLHIELDEALLVHGMLETGVPLAEQRDVVLAGTLTGQKYMEKNYERPWTEMYDGDKPIVVGHRDFLGTGEPFVRDDERVWGIDTGVYHGGRLTGLLLPDFELIQVAARVDHWSIQKARYADLRYDLDRAGAMKWHQLEQLAAASRRADAPSEETAEKIRGLLDMAEKAHRSLEAVFDHVTSEDLRLKAELNADMPFDGMSPAEQGRAYAGRISDHTFRFMLHAARLGRLKPADLRKKWPTPGALRSFLLRVGQEDLWEG